MELLGCTVRNGEAICQPLHPDLAFDGVLGVNLTEDFNVWIDNDSETVTLERCREQHAAQPPAPRAARPLCPSGTTERA